MWGTRDDWWEGSRPGTDTCDPTTAAPVGQSPLSSTRLNSHSGTCPLLPTPSLQLVCPALSLDHLIQGNVAKKHQSVACNEARWG